MKIIEITVSPTGKGQSKVETRGLHRRRAPRSKQVHRAGPWSSRTDEKLTAEFHQDQAIDQQLKQSQ